MTSVCQGGGYAATMQRLVRAPRGRGWDDHAVTSVCSEGEGRGWDDHAVTSVCPEGEGMGRPCSD